MIVSLKVIFNGVLLCNKVKSFSSGTFLKFNLFSNFFNLLVVSIKFTSVNKGYFFILNRPELILQT